MIQIATCLFVLLCIAHGKILESPKDTEAVVGENVTLKYRTDDTSHHAEWRYKKVPVSTEFVQFEIIYKRKTIFDKFTNRFYVDPNTTTTGQHDLHITDVQVDDAGRYTASNSNAELIVFDKYPSPEFCTITSASTDNQNGCESESLTISCDLRYRGNRNLTLEWLDGDNTIPSTVENNADGSITSSIQLQKSQLKTAKITCRVRYQTSMTTSRFTWLPSVNITPTETMSDLKNEGCELQTVECSDGKNPDCQYAWKDENGTEVSSSSSMQMAGKPNGNYTCFATCKVHQASCSHVAKMLSYRCDDIDSQSTSATSATSSQETFAPPGSLKNSQEITSPGMYIGLPVASVILIAVILLVALLLFRRSFFVCNGTARGNHTINDVGLESGRTHNSNHIDMTPFNATILEGPTEKDAMLTDTHGPHNNGISEMPERNRGLTETSDGVS